MATILTELDTILERMLVISKDEKSLRGIFEEAALEMTTVLSPEESIGLKSARITQDTPLQMFSAFRLGKRGPFNIRICLAGASLDKRVPDDHLWKMCDFILLDLDPKDPNSDRLLQSNIPVETKHLPVVVKGLHDSSELRAKALTRWVQNNFGKYHFLKNPDRILSESLEWSLSF